MSTLENRLPLLFLVLAVGGICVLVLTHIGCEHHHMAEGTWETTSPNLFSVLAFYPDGTACMNPGSLGTITLVWTKIDTRKVKISGKWDNDPIVAEFLIEERDGELYGRLFLLGEVEYRKSR